MGDIRIIAPGWNRSEDHERQLLVFLNLSQQNLANASAVNMITDSS